VTRSPLVRPAAWLVVLALAGSVEAQSKGEKKLIGSWTVSDPRVSGKEGEIVTVELGKDRSYKGGSWGR